MQPTISKLPSTTVITIIIISYRTFHSFHHSPVVNMVLYVIVWSMALLIFSILYLSCDDAGVAWLKVFRCLVKVLVCWNELSLVVGASITNHDLGGILIRHHHSGLWKSTSESIWMIGLQRLLEHASVQIISYFELVLGYGSYFG